MDYPARFSTAARIGLDVGVSGAMPPSPDSISLAYGLPDPASFPTEALERVSRTVLSEQSASALQYGNPQGDPRLRHYLAERLNEQEGLSLRAEQLAVTSGSSQAIALVSQLLTDPGDTILIEGPTFLGAVRTFQLARPRIEELPLDDHGLVVAELERRLARLRDEGTRPKFLYTLPTFQNPAGVTMPLERRLDLLRIAREHQLLVVEDDAYGELRYDGSPVPSLLSLDRDGLVVRLGTFSKILAPGMRLGWVAGPADLVTALPVVKQDGGTNPYAAHLATEWAVSGGLEPHVKRLRSIYRERRDVMLAGLERYCTPYCSWTRPEGGFFIWVELKPSVNPAALLLRAAELGVQYLPGEKCFASGEGQQFLRLCFSYQSPDKIELGMQRLGQAMAEVAR